MTDRATAADRLLAAILNGQIEPASGNAISEARILAALTTGPRLTAEERRRLWLSPAARATYLAVKRRILGDMLDRMRQEGIELELTARVAAGGGDVLTIQGREFSVVLQRHVGPDGLWLITLRLDQRLRSLLGPATTVRLVDTGGVEWLSGHPNQMGEINAVWAHADIAPGDRLTAHRLALEFA